VTPGKAVNGERCSAAPVSRKVPLKAMSPGMAFRCAARFAAAVPAPPLAGLELPDEGAADEEEPDEEEADEDVLEPAGRA